MCIDMHVMTLLDRPWCYHYELIRMLAKWYAEAIGNRTRLIALGTVHVSFTAQLGRLLSGESVFVSWDIKDLSLLVTCTLQVQIHTSLTCM